MCSLLCQGQGTCYRAFLQMANCTLEKRQQGNSLSQGSSFVLFGLSRDLWATLAAYSQAHGRGYCTSPGTTMH